MQTPAVAGDLFGADVDTASAYAHLLASRGVEWGLIGPREVDRIDSAPLSGGLSRFRARQRVSDYAAVISGIFSTSFAGWFMAWSSAMEAEEK